MLSSRLVRCTVVHFGQVTVSYAPWARMGGWRRLIAIVWEEEEEPSWRRIGRQLVSYLGTF